MTYDSTTTGDQLRVSGETTTTGEKVEDDVAILTGGGAENIVPESSSLSLSPPLAASASSSSNNNNNNNNNINNNTNDNNHEIKASTESHQSGPINDANNDEHHQLNHQLQCSSVSTKLNNSPEAPIKTNANNNEHHTTATTNGTNSTCYNQLLDDEIRARLDKLNALSDLINSLERQFDEANCIFRDTLKCSTDRLSSIAKILGSKSIKQGRLYNEAKLSVEQSQSDCQRACVQFEQANKDHQFAKRAIKEAELKLKEVAGGEMTNGVIAIPNVDTEMLKLSLADYDDEKNSQSKPLHRSECDTSGEVPGMANHSTVTVNVTATTKTITIDSQAKSSEVQEIVEQDDTFATKSAGSAGLKAQEINEVQNGDQEHGEDNLSPRTSMINNAAKLSEELNQAILRLIEAEKQRGLSEMQHLDRANKLMVAQENLLKLEREHGPSIRRSQLYFDEAKRFNAKLNSVKGDICRISEDILAAKQAYARTLSELEQFSDDLHDSSSTTTTTATT